MTLLECEDRLKEARDGYHALMTGTRARVIVDQNGQRVEFAAATKGDLYSYIQGLESICGCQVGGVAPSIGGPARFIF